MLWAVKKPLKDQHLKRSKELRSKKQFLRLNQLGIIPLDDDEGGRRVSDTRPDGNALDVELATPGAPVVPRHLLRMVVKPIYYSKEQEKEVRERISKRSAKSRTQKDPDIINQVQLRQLCETNNTLQQQAIELSTEPKERDKERKNCDSENQTAIAALQTRLETIRQETKVTY